MHDILSNLFASDSFIPHEHCYLWKPGLVWLHLSSDALIALAYYSIPITLFYFVRQRKDLPFNWIFLLFAAFIVACGTTHIAGIWTLWYPTYWLSGTIKAGTAFISVFTALQLVPLVPQALALPSPAQLERANADLHAQIQERLRVEQELRNIQNQLEQRVQERTTELTKANEQLQEEIRERQAALLERQRTEEALRDREEQFRQLAENIHEVFWMSNLQQSQILYISPAYEKIWGRSCQSLYEQSKSWLESVHPDDQEQVKLLVSNMVDGADFNEEYRIVRPDQSIRWIWARTSPVRNEAGEIYRIAGIAEDITDRKQAEAEREQLLERERIAREQAVREAQRSADANRIKDEFLAVLSHELRTPLNPILGWLKLLRSGKLDQQKTATALETIDRNAKLQTQLIEDLLDVSRILQGKMTLNVSPVNLTAIVEAAQETVRLAAESKSIQIHLQFQPINKAILGDPNRLQQVVWNLLSNAVKFTPAGGQVEVILKQIDAPIDTEPKKPSAPPSLPQTQLIRSYAQIQIKDTGKGITPEFLPYVFDTFRQADGTTTRQFGGLGLGLSIVRQIVELHGGSVLAESLGEYQGATFTVRLPLMAAASTLEKPAEQSLKNLDLNGIHVLVVDDEIDTRKLLTFILEHWGATVTAAASAEEGLATFAQSTPDILLSDIGMPKMDGYSFIRQIRALEPTQGGRIPAIALTAYADDSSRQRAISTGFQFHIAKPVEIEKLMQAIAQILPGYYRQNETKKGRAN